MQASKAMMGKAISPLAASKPRKCVKATSRLVPSPCVCVSVDCCALRWTCSADVPLKAPAGARAALFIFGDSKRIPRPFHVPPRSNQTEGEAACARRQSRSLNACSGSFVVNACLARKGLDDWMVKQKYYCSTSREDQQDCQQKNTCGLAPRVIDHGGLKALQADRLVTALYCEVKRGVEGGPVCLRFGILVNAEEHCRFEEEKCSGNTLV
ncbi:Protein naked cuticle -like protein 1 [Triplophysa tibetana]|uniref:Protein naked cuticle-like protein 1 n=1 Tax=Triplophysa tibetana TaxID=1572043 RepID=A0A5A9PR10_9TELE|nr:Protein naked cuticle -like protein 1 [Triplophysa tibetana]